MSYNSGTPKRTSHPPLGPYNFMLAHIYKLVKLEGYEKGKVGPNPDAPLPNGLLPKSPKEGSRAGWPTSFFEGG